MPRIFLVANTGWFLYNFRRALAQDLREIGWDVTLVSPADDYVAQLTALGFRCLHWPLGRRSLAPWGEMRSVLHLTRIYQTECPDLVHHHTLKAVLYGTIAARLTAIPAVVNSITGRGYLYSETGQQARLLQKAINPLLRWVLRFPRLTMIFENQSDRCFFLRSGMIDKSQAVLIQGVGVDPQVFHPVPEPHSTPVVLFAGRMLRDKGVDMLVEATRQLKSRVAVRVVLVGKPDPGNPNSLDESQLRQWEQEGLVEWMGWRSDMARVYAQCHIVTLPTRYGEGVPTALIEGAASGRPLVGTQTPGCQTIIQEGINGFLVPPDDHQALACRLEQLICDASLRRAMGANSRKLFEQWFTQRQVNDETIAVYTRLLEEIGMQ